MVLCLNITCLCIIGCRSCEHHNLDLQAILCDPWPLWWVRSSPVGKEEAGQGKETPITWQHLSINNGLDSNLWPSVRSAAGPGCWRRMRCLRYVCIFLAGRALLLPVAWREADEGNSERLCPRRRRRAHSQSNRIIQGWRYSTCQKFDNSAVRNPRPQMICITSCSFMGSIIDLIYM